MAAPLEKSLERWISGGAIDTATAERIRTFEARQNSSERLRWPILLALALGGLLLCAGVLLFVAAHWDELSPSWRFSLALLMVAAFPIAGAFLAERFRALSLTFYAVGTVCTGAGIFLAAQIFNLQEHWPNGILLWAIGALAGWVLLRNWTQAALLAVLVPAWLAGEWEVRTYGFQIDERVVALGLLFTALTYLSSRTAEEDSPTRLALTWIGGISLLPSAVWAFVDRYYWFEWWRSPQHLSTPELATAWILAIGAPLLLAVLLRKRMSWTNVIAAVWVLMIATLGSPHTGAGVSAFRYAWDSLGPYFWAALGALGLIGWGLMERRRERINMGVLGFALTVAIFYFSDVMDKLGRSASLIGMGLLLLVGGWVLEKTRRRLITRIERSAA